MATYRRELVAQYEVGTVAVKLAAIRRLYEAAVWRGLRQDNPAAGLKAPKDKTERSERIKFLPITRFVPDRRHCRPASPPSKNRTPKPPDAPQGLLSLLWSYYSNAIALHPPHTRDIIY